jgi:hypothetical protein
LARRCPNGNGIQERSAWLAGSFVRGQKNLDWTGKVLNINDHATAPAGTRRGALRALRDLRDLYACGCWLTKA